MPRNQPGALPSIKSRRMRQSRGLCSMTRSKLAPPSALIRLMNSSTVRNIGRLERLDVNA